MEDLDREMREFKAEREKEALEDFELDKALREDNRVSIDLAMRVSAWLRIANVEHSGMDADFCDISYAAKSVGRLLEEVLKLDPTRPEDANRALRYLTKIEIDLFREMTHHIAELKQQWPALEKRVLSLSRPPRKQKKRGGSA